MLPLSRTASPPSPQTLKRSESILHPSLVDPLALSTNQQQNPSPAFSHAPSFSGAPFQDTHENTFQDFTENNNNNNGFAVLQPSPSPVQLQSIREYSASPKRESQNPFVDTSAFDFMNEKIEGPYENSLTMTEAARASAILEASSKAASPMAQQYNSPPMLATRMYSSQNQSPHIALPAPQFAQPSFSLADPTPSVSSPTRSLPQVSQPLSQPQLQPLSQPISQPASQPTSARVIQPISSHKPFFFSGHPFGRHYGFTKWTSNDNETNPNFLSEKAGTPWQNLNQSTLFTQSPNAAAGGEIKDITIKRQEVLLKIIRSLYAFGCPTHALEKTVPELGCFLELVVHVAVLPGLIIVAFGEAERHTSETFMIRQSGSYDMDRLNRLHGIIRDMITGKVTVEETDFRIGAVRRLSEPYPWYIQTIAYCALSLTCPFFYGGSMADCAVSSFLGLFVGLLDRVTVRYPHASDILPFIVSAICSFVAMSARIAFGDKMCWIGMTFGGIVWMLPGLSITFSVLELGTGNVISGTVHMFSCFLGLFTLSYGMVAGQKLAMALWHNHDVIIKLKCDNHASLWLQLAFIPITISMCVLLKASPRQWPLMMSAALGGYITAYVSGLYISSSLTTAFAAFVVALISNVIGKWTDENSFNPLILGVIFLVPGSMGVRGAAAFLQDDLDSSASFALQMFATALAITIGIFSANILVPISGLVTSTQSLAAAADVAPPPIPPKANTSRGPSQCDAITQETFANTNMNAGTNVSKSPQRMEEDESQKAARVDNEGDRLKQSTGLIDFGQ